MEAARDRQFAGELVNGSEGRAALHPALRAPDGAAFSADGLAVSQDIEATRRSVADFATRVRSGAFRGVTGETIAAVVHIGIGGSDLGPRLVWAALKPLEPDIDIRFVANVDPAEIAQALAGLDPARTLVVAVSKSFSTEETLANAQAARAWLCAKLGPAGDGHLIAVSADPHRAQGLGVRDDQMFRFWDWVGGRYSLWSAVSLSLAIGLGPEKVAELHAGAAAMDDHFRQAPLARNAPVLLALAHAFNRNALGRPTRAVVPYAQRLALLPAFLQQLEMESNGKGVDITGRPVARATAAAVFGEPGTNGQHAFFQMLHQGTDVIPVDFLAVRQARDGDPAAQVRLLANAVAQAEALMVGRQGPDVVPERLTPGNRPSSFILMERLDATALGALLALYEHKTFVEGALWDVNSFDQWGVELGKTLAAQVLAELEGGAPVSHDPSTQALIDRLR